VKKHSVAIGILISALFLYLAFRRADLGEIYAQLRVARYWILVPAVALTILSLWVRAYRWGFLLHPLKRIGPGTLFSATAIGFMCNNLLPMRLGELIRAFVIGRSTGVRASAAFATIVVERLFDLFAMIGLFGFLLVFAPFHNRPFKMGALMACIGGLIALGLLILFHLRPHTCERWLRPLLPRLVRERVLSLLRSFAGGLEIFRDLPRLLGVAGLTIVMWLLIAIVIKLCFSAARLEELGSPLPPTASLVSLVVIAIGVMVPSGPGFVGTMHAAAVFGLEIVGYRHADLALSFAILYHASQWVPVVIVGLIYLVKENLSLGQVKRISSERDLEEGDLSR